MVAKMVVKSISMSLVDGPETPLRELIDVEKIRELAESIRSIGLQNPITVRLKGDRYEVVSGHRRFLAHKLLGLEMIPCIIRDVENAGMLVARCVENIQREDLSPMETARVYKALRDEYGYSLEKMSQVVGKNKMTVWKYVQLLGLPEDFQQAVDKGLLSMSVAIELMKVDEPEFRKYFLKSAVESGITLPVAQMWVGDYERSRGGQYYVAGEGGGAPVDETPILPTYVTCGACHAPVDVRLIKTIGVCGDCFRLIAFAKTPDELSQVGKGG